MSALALAVDVSGAAWPALGVALLLGLRHAADPDHVAAVATLALGGERRGPRAAARLGLAWGLGHGLVLCLLGLPVVIAGAALPEALGRAAEVGVGVVIAALGARLVLRWRRGELHAHAHVHGTRWHAHPHFHDDPRARGAPAASSHASNNRAAPAHGPHAHPGAHTRLAGHEHGHVRTPLAAFGVGMVHGVGGSAAAGVLVVAAAGRDAAGALALALFAAGTAAAMATASAALGIALASGPLARRLERFAPALGLAGVAFGAWYALGALATGPGGH